MLFFWDWHPLTLFGLTLFLTYGVIQGLRAFAPGEEWTWSRWWTYKFGDAFIAGFVMFAAICFQHGSPEGWFTDWWPHLFLFALGMTISFGIQFREIVSGNMSREVASLPSEWYHAVIRGFLIYVVAQSAIALVFDSRNPIWAFALAIVCLLVYVGTFIYDSSALQDHSRVERGNR